MVFWYAECFQLKGNRRLPKQPLTRGLVGRVLAYHAQSSGFETKNRLVAQNQVWWHTAVMEAGGLEVQLSSFALE